MAMMIVKFHKLIQSKVVWYIVLGIIVIAFVGFFTPTMGNKSSKRPTQNAGELFGEKVTAEKYSHAYQSSKIWYIFSTGQMPEQTQAFSDALLKQAWERLAILHKAEAEQVVVTDQEVVHQIQQMPVFQNQSGQFDGAAYKIILQNLGLSATQVEGVIREQVAIQKMMTRPVQAALVPPVDLQRAFHLYTDRIVLDYAVLPRTQVENDVTVSREEAEIFFSENMEAFRMPAKVRVSYVDFPVSNFLAKATLPEGAVLEAYTANREAYRVENEDVTAPVEYKAFEEVEAEIADILLMNAARRLAKEEATALVVAASPKTEGEQPNFKGVVEAAGMAIQTRPAFGVDDPLRDIDETSPFRQAAFRLEDDLYNSFSDAVVGKDHVYILSLEKRYASFLPTFDVVQGKVMEAAKSQAVSEALSTQAMDIQEVLFEAMVEGVSFKDALAPYSLTIESTDEFDLSTELDHPYARALIPGCVNTPQGALCQVASVAEGVAFSCVAQRTSIDADLGLPAVRDEIIAGLSGSQAQRLVADWQAEILREADLKIDGE